MNLDVHKYEHHAAILIVDDEPNIADMLAETLKCPEFEIEVVYNGKQALQRLEARPFDALLTDIHMPYMRGDELQRIARERDPNLAVLLISAANDLACAVQCLREGAYDYMSKPFNLQDVTIRVHKALERRRLVRENQDYQANLERRVQEQADRIRLMFQSSLQALNHALEAKDGYTRDHSFRVTEFTCALATRLCPEKTAFHQKIRLAAMFHDIGKIGVPEAVLQKPDVLTPEEFAEIQKHPVIGEIILKPLFADPEMLAIVRHHHEQWNGSGYPDRLGCEEIPYGARIVAVADAYDAMTSARPYRLGMPPEKALQILHEGADSQWDASIIAVFLQLAEAGELTLLAQRPPGTFAPRADETNPFDTFSSTLELLLPGRYAA